MAYWRTKVVHQSEGERGSLIEELKIPFQYAMEEDWEGLKKYYKERPQDLIRPITVYGNTVFHVIAALCSSQSQGKRVLEFLINSLMSTYDEKCYALRLPDYSGNNALHEMAVSGNLEATEFLVSHFNEPAEDVATTDDENATLPLLEIRNHLGETPLYRAAALGHTDLVKFYANKLEENPDNLWRHFYRNDRMSILHIAVIGQHFETALWLQKNYQFLAQEREDKGLTCLQLLAQMATAFKPEFQESKWKMLIYYCLPDGDLVIPNQKDDVESSLDRNQPRQSICWKKGAVILKVYSSLWDFLAKGTGGRQGIIYKIWKDKKNKKSLDKLIASLVKKDYSWENTNQAKPKTISLGSVDKLVDADDPKGEKGKRAADPLKSDKPVNKVYDYSPLLIATITGIVPIVEEIIAQHPQAAEHVSYNEQNILHLAIKNRQIEIFKLIKSKPTLMLRLNERIDGDGNTILHQAADRSYYSIAVSQNLIGPAMQLQAELLWMERVKDIVPPHYAMHHNNKAQTAQKLFYEEHNDLLKQAQEWMKDTAQSCSTVAVLVATVVFAAAYTIPGGNDQSGLPVFHNDPLFWFFTCMDVVAIAFSLSSVAFFLSILSSPLEYPLFSHSLPRKIMIGFVLLFLSMATTMLAFAATILLLIRVEKKWTRSLLYPVAFFPVPLFGLLQFPMYQFVQGTVQSITKIFRSFLSPYRSFSKGRSICGKSKAQYLKA